MQRGFTLLELLVSISIIALLIGTGIPAFRHFGRVQALDQAADQVKGAILDTRAYALGPRAEKPATTTTYEIQFNSIAQTYQLFEGATALGSPTTLPPFIQLASSPTIQFSVTNAGVVILPASGPISITLTNSQLGSATQRIVTVNRQTGAVSITRSP